MDLGKDQGKIRFRGSQLSCYFDDEIQSMMQPSEQLRRRLIRANHTVRFTARCAGLGFSF